jgi:hypothetical protein
MITAISGATAGTGVEVDFFGATSALALALMLMGLIQDGLDHSGRRSLSGSAGLGGEL